MFDYRIVINSSDSNTVYCGSDINGAVILRSDKKIKARKIDLKIVGRAQTNWNTGNIYYGCREDYIDEYLILWESPDDSNQLPPNVYNFPFNIRIPENAPSNFIDTYGDVKYYIHSTIDVPRGLDKKAFYDLNVLDIIDLNIDRGLSLEACAEATKNVKRFPSCSSNPIFLKASIPRTGYICGEEILVSLNIQNRSSAKVKYFEIGFIEDSVYIGNDSGIPALPTEDSLKTEWTIKKFPQRFKPPFNETYAITVPEMSPSFLHCSIIKITYQLFVKVHAETLFSSSGPEVRIPITIGTVSIQDDSVFKDDDSDNDKPPSDDDNDSDNDNDTRKNANSKLESD